MSTTVFTAAVGNKVIPAQSRHLRSHSPAKNLSPGCTWVITPCFLALRSVSDRVVSPDPSRRFVAPADAQWEITGTVYGAVVLQLCGSDAGQTCLYLRQEELTGNGTCIDPEEPAQSANEEYLVLSRSGRTLGTFTDQAVALSAMANWFQAISVVCGSTVIARKGAERIAA